MLYERGVSLLLFLVGCENPSLISSICHLFADDPVQSILLSFRCFFFFQAEDGIRDYKVTGVQTCALPICFVTHATVLATIPSSAAGLSVLTIDDKRRAAVQLTLGANEVFDVVNSHEQMVMRSEERRVGKECRYEWWRGGEEKNAESEDRRR